MTYVGRTTSVGVTLDGVFNDGEPGEGDNVATDVEDAVGALATTPWPEARPITISWAGPAPTPSTAGAATTR